MIFVSLVYSSAESWPVFPEARDEGIPLQSRLQNDRRRRRQDVESTDQGHKGCIQVSLDS